MGRKSTNKARSTNETKRNQWVRQLYPFFKNRGLLGFSMEEVASYLGVSKATIYNYFTSKNEIIDGFLHGKFVDFADFERKLNNPDQDLVSTYEDALYHLVNEMSDLSPEVRHDLQHIFPEKWNQLMTILGDYLQKLRSHYERGIQEGVYREFNPDLLLICDRNMLFYMSDTSDLMNNGLTLRQAFDEYIVVRKHGMLVNS